MTTLTVGLGDSLIATTPSPQTTFGNGVGKYDRRERADGQHGGSFRLDLDVPDSSAPFQAIPAHFGTREPLYRVRRIRSTRPCIQCNRELRSSALRTHANEDVGR